MDIVKTSTGKTFKCDYFNPFLPAKQINIRILETDIATVASVFSNSTETVQLWCGDQYVSQHTNLLAVIPEGDAIRVVLSKEA